MLKTILFCLLLCFFKLTTGTILTVHDDSTIRKKVCVEKDAATIAIMLRNYKCVQNRLNPKYQTVIESCWTKSGYKAGYPKTDEDWSSFYCSNKYPFIYKYIADRCIIKSLYDEADALKDETSKRMSKIKTFISLSTCLILSHRDHPLLPHAYLDKIEDDVKVQLKLEKCDPKDTDCVLNEKHAHKVITDMCAKPTSENAVKLTKHMTFNADGPDLSAKLKHCFKLVTGRPEKDAPETPAQWGEYACKKDRYALTVSKVVSRCMDIVYNIDDKDAVAKAKLNYPRFSDSAHSHFFRDNWDRERRERICVNKDVKLAESYVNQSFKCFVDHMDDPALESALTYCFNEHQTNPNKIPIPKTLDEWVKFACQWKREVLPVIETESCLEKMMNFGSPWIDNLVPWSELNEDKKIPKCISKCSWMKLMSREELEEHSYDAEHQSHRYYPFVRNAHEVIKGLKEEEFVPAFDPCAKNASNESKSLLIDQKKCVLRIATFRKEVDLLKECYKEIGLSMPESDDEILKMHCNHTFPWIYEDAAILCLIRKQKWDGQIIHEYQSCFPHDLDKVILKSMEWYSLSVLYEGDVRLDVNGENELMKLDVCMDKHPIAMQEIRNEYEKLQKCQGTFFDSCHKELIGEFPKDADSWIKWYCKDKDPSSSILAVQMCNKLHYITSPKGSGQQCLHEEPQHEEDVLTPDHKISFPILEYMDNVMRIARSRYYEHICVKKNQTWIKKYLNASVACFDHNGDMDHKFLFDYCWNKDFKGISVPKNENEWLAFACSKTGEIVDDTRVQNCMKAVLSLESSIVTDKISPHYRYYDSMQNPFDESPKCLNKALWSITALRKEEEERDGLVKVAA